MSEPTKKVQIPFFKINIRKETDFRNILEANYSIYITYSTEANYYSGQLNTACNKKRAFTFKSSKSKKLQFMNKQFDNNSCNTIGN